MIAGRARARRTGSSTAVSPQTVDHEIGDAAVPVRAEGLAADAPEEAHQQQHVLRGEPGADAAVRLAGAQQRTDGADDAAAGLVDDGVLGRRAVQGLTESVLDADAVGEGREPGAERLQRGVPGEDVVDGVDQALDAWR